MQQSNKGYIFQSFEGKYFKAPGKGLTSLKCNAHVFTEDEMEKAKAFVEPAVGKWFVAE